MNLIEAIVDANHRALAGDNQAGLRPADFADSLPMVALTCIDPRLNPLMPSVLGISPEDFIWLRNAGNIITGPMSSTIRSLALACAIKGGKEIVIIGHTECRVRQTNALALIDGFKKLGVDRSKLPDNLNEFFGLFASEQQNVIKAVDFVRRSPLIGQKTPVHGLMIDINTGRLDWVVNGNQAATTVIPEVFPTSKAEGTVATSVPAISSFNIGEMKLPEDKIGSGTVHADKWARPGQPVEPPAPARSGNPGYLEKWIRQVQTDVSPQPPKVDQIKTQTGKPPPLPGPPPLHPPSGPQQRFRH